MLKSLHLPATMLLFLGQLKELMLLLMTVKVSPAFQWNRLNVLPYSLRKSQLIAMQYMLDYSETLSSASKKIISLGMVQQLSLFRLFLAPTVPPHKVPDIEGG
jgi:hypothetical protein